MDFDRKYLKVLKFILIQTFCCEWLHLTVFKFFSGTTKVEQNPNTVVNDLRDSLNNQGETYKDCKGYAPDGPIERIVKQEGNFLSEPITLSI